MAPQKQRLGSALHRFCFLLIWLYVVFGSPVVALEVQQEASRSTDSRSRDDVKSCVADADRVRVVYLGNEGVLLEGACREGVRPRVLIDALFGEGIGGYPSVEEGLRRELENGQGLGASVTVALASHFHGDHFNAESVLRYLENDPKAQFVSTPQAIDALKAAAKKEVGVATWERVKAVLPAEGAHLERSFPGVEVQWLNLHHGRRSPPVENLGTILSMGPLRFIHFGDTEAKHEDFEPHLERLADVDVALLPFWFLTSSWRIELVQKEIRPKAIVVLHLPTPDAPASYFGRWESYDNVVELIRSNFPEAWIPLSSGQELNWPSGKVSSGK